MFWLKKTSERDNGEMNRLKLDSYRDRRTYKEVVMSKEKDVEEKGLMKCKNNSEEEGCDKDKSRLLLRSIKAKAYRDDLFWLSKSLILETT